MSFAARVRKAETEPERKAGTSSAGLRIGKPDDAFEREADRLADQAMTGRAGKAEWSFSRMSVQAPLQRKCSCGGSGECEECNKKEASLQRKTAGSGPVPEVPPIVHEVLGSPGRPLDSATRAFFEQRLDHDFSRVRIHTGERAAESARAVHALAYTVGDNIAMGSDQYAPATDRGRRLLAHELVHVMQQSSRPAARVAGRLPSSVLARACFTKEVCESKAEQSPQQLMEEVTGQEENKKKREDRRKACTKKPARDPACTADGHGRRAVEAEKVLRSYDPTRLNLIKQIVVDMDMETGFGALTGACSSFMPPVLTGGGMCTFVPERIETESAQFNNTMDKEIAGRSRDEWRDHTLQILMHETEHAHFDTSGFIARPRPAACKFEDIQDALSEIAAMLQEFPIVFRQSRENVTFTPEKRKEVLDNWFTFRITNKHQSFKSTLHSIYCLCECADAAEYVKKTISFTTASWSNEEKTRFHSELQDPKWAAHDLRWPVSPPASPSAAGPAPAAPSTGTP